MRLFASRVLSALGLISAPWDVREPDWLLPNLYPETTDKTMSLLSEIGVSAVEFEKDVDPYASMDKKRLWFAKVWFVDGSARLIDTHPLYEIGNMPGRVNGAGPQFFAKWLHVNNLVLSTNPKRKGLWQLARRGEKTEAPLIPHPEVAAESLWINGAKYTTETTEPVFNAMAVFLAQALNAQMSEKQRSEINAAIQSSTEEKRPYKIARIGRRKEMAESPKDIERKFPERLRGEALAVMEQAEMRDLLANQKLEDMRSAEATPSASSTLSGQRKARAL